MDLQEYISQRVVDLMMNAEVFDEKIKFIQKRLSELQKFIRDHKSKNPDLTYVDVKSQLTEFHSLHYESHLIHNDYVRIIANLIEVYSTAKLFKLVLPLPEEKVKILDDLLVNSGPSLFVVEKREIKIANPEMYDLATAGLQQQITDEAVLKEAFQSPVFDPV
jgi:hypothetical protein